MFHSRYPPYIVREHLVKVVHSASFNTPEREDPSKCHPDTWRAVHNSLAAWRRDPEAGPVQLISGWAGTGKTTIARTMAQHWAKEHQLGGSFAFSKSSDESTIEWVPAAILHQFLQTFGADMNVGQLTQPPIYWHELVDALVSTSPPIPPSVVIVIDGIDECSTDRQAPLLRHILNSAFDPRSSIKYLISCRLGRHLEDVFDEFASKLGSSYHIRLGQFAENDIRTFLQVSFDRICQLRRRAWAISATDGPWPSEEEIEGLVEWASGQFIFAAIVVQFVDNKNEDPVEKLNQVLGRQTSSFSAIDELYIAILNRVGEILDESDTPPERRQMMHNLILHVHHEPSSAAVIADFWFEKEVIVSILVMHLEALLVRPTDPDGRDPGMPIQFRHKSFHDFLAHPSQSHPFSFAEMNPVSKFFFSLRTHTRNAASRPRGWALQSSQWLAYAFLCCDDHPPAVLYEEEARRLHQSYLQYGTTFRGCECLPQLEPTTVRNFKSCGQKDCVINPDLLALCRMMAISIDDFIREWKEQERLKTISFPLIKFLLWLRVLICGLLSNPSYVLGGSIQALTSSSSSSSWLTRCTAAFNGQLCIMILLNARCDVVLLLHVSHTAASFFLRWFLHFGALQP
ncbi:hypothetical protein BDN72DRAFT_625671, partial [Pluteus cervinus]